MLKTTLAGILAHKVRLLLTMFAIVLGVAFVSATLVVSDGLQAVFDHIFTTTGVHVAAVVRGHVVKGGDNGGFAAAHHPIPESLLAQVQAVSGVHEAAGIVFEDGAVLLGPDGQPYPPTQGPPHFGTNWVDTNSGSSVSPYHLRSGAAPTHPNDVVIDAATASAHNIRVGQKVGYVFLGGPREDFVVSGITGYGTADNLAGAPVALFTLATIERVFDYHNTFDQIDASANSGISDSQLRDRIAATMPASAEVATGATVTGEQIAGAEQLVGVIRTTLLVFAAVALFVGSFLIVNTFNILIAQRTRELALLRALGASRGQVMRSVLLEAVITGVVASAVGCAAGVLVAQGLYAAINGLGANFPAITLSINPTTIAIGMTAGTSITALAAILPAYKATRVAPVEALREATQAATPLGRPRITTGALLTLAGSGLFGLGLFAGTGIPLQLLGAGAVVAFVGIALLIPLAVTPVAGLLGLPIQAWRKVPGKLARLNSIRAPRRTASTAAALMIGVALAAGTGVLVDSLKVSATVVINDFIRADFVVLPSGGAGGSPAVSTAAATALRKDSAHFSTVVEVRGGTVLVNNVSAGAVALDPATYPKVLNIDVASGDPAAITSANTIMVDQQEASAHGWKVGDTIPVEFPQSDKSNTAINEHIGCIFIANAVVSGYVLSEQTYTDNFPAARDQGILLALAPNVSASAGQQAMISDLRGFPTLTGYDKAGFLELNNAEADAISLFADLFLSLAIVIAALGIVNTMALSIIERTRELGLLRALGLSQQQTRTMVRWESVLIAVLGTVLGIAVGTVMGVAAVHALANAGIGHTAVPWDQFGWLALGAVLVGLGAAILPARRAARLNILDAISTE